MKFMLISNIIPDWFISLQVSINDGLQDNGKHIPSTTLGIAEASRPHHAIKDDIRPDDSSPGCKRVHDTIDAVRVNWQNPILWSTIQRAAVIHGFGMPPAILCQLSKKSTVSTLRKSLLKWWGNGLIAQVLS